MNTMILFRTRPLFFARAVRGSANSKKVIPKPDDNRKFDPSLESIRERDEQFFIRQQQHKRGAEFREEYESLERRAILPPDQAAAEKQTRSKFPVECPSGLSKPLTVAQGRKAGKGTRAMVGRQLNNARFDATAILDDDKLFQAYKHLPFRIKRTINGNLPVFQTYRRGGVESYSVVKQVEGQWKPLQKMLQQVCESPVRVRTGAIEVKGVHTWKIKEWLTTLGF